MLNKKKISLLCVSVLAITSVFLMNGNNESTTHSNELSQIAKVLPLIKPDFAEKVSIKNSLPPKPALITRKEATPPLSYIDTIKASSEKSSFQEALLKDHQLQSKYPDYNQGIASIEQDPIERRYELDERTTQNEAGDHQLTIWTDQKYYLHGDEVIVFASLEDLRGVRLNTEFLGQLVYNESQSLQQFKFHDADQDGIYEYRLTLDQDSDPVLLAGLYKVLIVNSTNEMVDAASFTLSQPEVQLTGEYRDLISPNGDLLIQAEVDVAAKNRFYFQAALYSSTNDPIGTTQISGDLLPGRHWIDLAFDGLMIRDAEEPGPYLLKSISLAKVAFPIQRAPLIYPEFYTQGYSVDQFRNTNYAAADALP